MWEKMISTFARRIGRGLRDNQKKLLSDFLPEIKVDFNEFKNFENITLEVGFGNGEFTLLNALKNNNDLHLACEPYLNGVSSLLGKIKENEVTNIRIFADDVRKLLDEMPNNILHKIYIICPDPWPKRRDNKRRILQKDFIELIRQKIRPSGELIFVTDHLGYAKWILTEINKCYEDFKSKTLTDFTKLPQDWHYTKYQRRGLDQGSEIYYFKLPK